MAIERKGTQWGETGKERKVSKGKVGGASEEYTTQAAKETAPGRPGMIELKARVE